MLTKTDIAKLMEQAPAEVLAGKPLRRRPTPLELKMSKRGADEWKARKAAEEAEANQHSNDD